MKIGLVCPLSFKTVGGIQTQTLLLGKELQKQHVEVVYFSPTPQTDRVTPPNHVQVGAAINLPNFNGSWSDYTYSFQGHEDLTELLRQQTIDLLHVQAPIIPFINWQLIQASPVPVIATLHSGWEKDSPVENWLFFVETIAKKLKPHIAQTIAVSQTARECERYFSDQTTIVIPNAVDLEALQKTRKKPALLTTQTYNLLFLGRLDKRKGMRELLLAMAELPPHELANIMLFVIGAGPLETEVKLLAQVLKIDNHITWLGKRSDAEKYAYLQHANALVAPSLAGESLGMILTEAMACGLPIICGNNRGYLETMNGYPGEKLVVDPTNAKLLAGAIKLLKNNQPLAEKIKIWELNQAKRYAVDMVTAAHLPIYQQVLNKL